MVRFSEQTEAADMQMCRECQCILNCSECSIKVEETKADKKISTERESTLVLCCQHGHSDNANMQIAGKMIHMFIIRVATVNRFAGMWSLKW